MKVDSITRRVIIEEAISRGWRVEYIDPDQVLYEIITDDERRCIFSGSMPQTTSRLASRIAADKALSYYYLQHIGVKIPSFTEYTSQVEAEKFLREYAPIVVKPLDGAQSKGVSVDIRTERALEDAVQIAKEYSMQVILQQQLSGKLYRILVVGGSFCAASLRSAPRVIGDGRRTVAELITEKNRDPRRGNDALAAMKFINEDKAKVFVGDERYNSVLSDGEELEVMGIASVSVGGDSIDVTDSVHEDYRRITEDVCQRLGLTVGGFDLMTDAIHKPLADGTLPFLELNSAPGLKLHSHPSIGEPQPVAAAILDAVFQPV